VAGKLRKKTKITVVRSRGLASARRLSSGSSMTSIRQTAKAIRAAPPKKEPSTLPDVQPHVPPKLMASRMSPSPPPSTTPLRTSRLRCARTVVSGETIANAAVRTAV
jgi:hypothetical protein